MGFLVAAILWLQRDCSAKSSGESLLRLFTVDGGNEWNFENEWSGAIGVGGFALAD